MKNLAFLRRASFEAFLLPIVALFILIVGIPYVIFSHSLYTTQYIFVFITGFFLVFIRVIAIINIRNKYVDMFLTIPIIIIALVVLIILGPITLIIVLVFPKTIYKASYILSTIIIFVAGIHLKFEGPVPEKNEQFIRIHNHTSLADEMLIIVTMGGRPWNTIFAEEIVRIPFFGGMLRKYAIPVDRNNVESRERAGKKAVVEIKKGKSFALFSEGKRLRVADFKNGIVLYEFQKGASLLACRNHLPIYPTVFVFPFFYKPREGQWWLSPRTIKVITCEKVTTEGKSIAEVDKEVFEIMHETLLKNLKKDMKNI